MQEGVEALLGAAADVGARAIALQQHPDFRRYVVSRAEEQTLVDLVIDRALQLLRDKNHFGAVVVDPMREIAANKGGALLDRFEARDLVDLKLLLSAGLTLAEVLRDAQQKHAGADPATLAWVLGTWRIPPVVSEAAKLLGDPTGDACGLHASTRSTEPRATSRSRPSSERFQQTSYQSDQR